MAINFIVNIQFYFLNNPVYNNSNHKHSLEEKKQKIPSKLNKVEQNILTCSNSFVLEVTVVFHKKH